MGGQLITFVSLGLLGIAAAQKGKSHIEYIDVFQVLNVDHNIAFRYIDNTLRGVDYNDDAKDWGDMHRFKYFQAEVYHMGGKTFLKWWVNDNKYSKLVIKNDEKTFTTSSTDLGVYPGEGFTDTFLLRRSSTPDYHSTYPAYITAQIGDSEYALNCADPGSEIYSKVNMKAFSSAEDLSSWNFFYFAKQVPLKDPNEVWRWVSYDSTYYFYNRASKSTLSPEKDKEHRLTVSTEWGEANRFTLIPRDQPYFEMYNFSKKTRDNTVPNSHFTVFTKDGYVTIENGGWTHWKFAKAGNDHVWGYFLNRNGRKMYQKDGFVRDTGTGSDAYDQWQMLRVYNDAATRAKSYAPSL